jgi:hypothetical protein
MKFCSAILALTALSGASAFVAPQAKVARSVLLSESQNSYFTESRSASSISQVSGAQPGLGGAIEQLGNIQNVWGGLTPTTVQGGSLRTWSFQTPAVESVQVFLKTEGRPLNCDIDLWQGPDNTPHKMRVYLEDGATRTFNAVIETPRGHNAVAIRNTGMLEFPILAHVDAEKNFIPVSDRMSPQTRPKTIQGGAIKTYPFSPYAQNVKILLRTDGRPLNARIELLQGPNNNKQVVEIYTEDGFERPFFMVLETPGVGNVVRIVNTAPVEFPLTAAVESYPFEVSPGSEDTIRRGGPSWENGGNGFFTR